MKIKKYLFIFVLFIFFLGFCDSSFAALSYADGAGKTILDKVVDQFAVQAKTWGSTIQTAATRLFWSLVLISMVWTFGKLILKKADIGDFFSELISFFIFTGFYFWLLTNAIAGHKIAATLVTSMQTLGNNASAFSTGSNFTAIMNIGYEIFSKTVSSLSLFSPVDSGVAVVLAIIILLCLTVISVNMLLLLIAGWVLMYGGVFLLGFGGARWTSDIALNYFKTVFGLGIQLLTMILIIGVGNALLTNFHTSMSTTVISYEELGVMTIASVALLILSSRLPTLLSGVITGSYLNSAGQGSFGGASITGAGMATFGAAAAALGLAADKLLRGAEMLKGSNNSDSIEDSVRDQTKTPDNFSAPNGGSSNDSGIPNPFNNSSNTAPLSKQDGS